MTDFVFWGASVGLAAASATAAAIASRAMVRAPLLARITTLDDELAREAAAARRREAETARRHAGKVGLLRRALGLSAEEDDSRTALAGRALAERIIERLHGLASVDRCVVADAEGLSWTADDFAGSTGLAAAAGAALSASLRGRLSRSLHVELADARHIVVRPLPGTMPKLALAVLSTSRPASSFALDAVLTHAALMAAADESDDGDDDPLIGWPARFSRTDAPVTTRIARELEEATSSVSCGSMALFVGDEMVAAYGSDGPRQDDLAIFAATLRETMTRVENRLGSPARRIDWVGARGAAITLAPIGVSRRTSVLVTRREGAVDGGAFDRLSGRLRRLLPAEPTTGANEVRA